jgi:endonuclease III
MNQKTITLIFDRLAQQNPNPTTELNYNNNFQLLIAVILSAQTTDISVNQVTKNLFAKAPNAHQLSALPLTTIEYDLKHIGLYKNKAKHIQQTSTILAQKFNGQVPNTRIELEQLPGVGRKTANVILNTLFHQPTLAVDTHVFRVSHRLNLAPHKTPLAVEKGLYQCIPKHHLTHAHHWLILHGRYTCRARNPLCEQCILADLCPYPNKTTNPCKKKKSRTKKNADQT